MSGFIDHIYTKVFGNIGLNNAKIGQSEKNTNDIIDVFYAYKQPVKADDIQLVKDFATVVCMDMKGLALILCRSLTNLDRVHYLQRYGLTREDCEEIKNSDKPFEVVFKKLSIYKGAYNKIEVISE